MRHNSGTFFKFVISKKVMRTIGLKDAMFASELKESSLRNVIKITDAFLVGHLPIAFVLDVVWHASIRVLNAFSGEY